MTSAVIDYTGIVSFFPKPHEDNPEELVVLVPDAQSRRPGHEPHECWLRVVHGQEVNDGLPTKPCEDGVAYLLEGILSLDGLAVDQGVQFWEKGEGNHLLLVPLRESDTTKKSRRLHRNLVDRQYDPRLVLRGKLDIGEISIPTEAVEDCDRWRFTHWATARGKDRLAQFVRQEVKLSEDSTLTLRLKPQHSDEQRLIVRPDEAGKLHIEIGNTLDACGPIGRGDGNDKHVRIYNRLAAMPKPMHELRFLEYHRVCRKIEDGEEVGGANCPPGWWRDSDDPP